MKCLNWLIFLAFIGVVFGGGKSPCGQITTDFAQILQKSELKIERVLNFITIVAMEYPGITNSFIEFYNCNLNTTTFILATGLSQMSGTNIKYILDIFSGAISPPFVSPLDCIQTELLSYSEFVANITLNVISQIESLAQVSPVDPSSNCSTIIEYITYYYKSVANIANTIEDIYSIDLDEFSSIGQRNLFLKFTNDLLTCQYLSLVDSIAELTNGNQDSFIPYLLNQTQSLPPPYNCIQGMIDDSNNQVNDSLNQFNDSITNPTTSPSSIDSCQPLRRQVEILQYIWADYMTNLSNHAIGSALQYPVLASAFAVDFACEANLMHDFAANAISSLSGVDSDYIYYILNGTVNQPFTSPLDCISKTLIAMQTKISSLKNTFIPQVKLLAIPSSVNISTCSTAYSGLISYVRLMSSIIGSKGSYVENGIKSFKTIGFDDLYLHSMASMLECIPRILGTYIGAALNSNSNALTTFVSGQSSKLPYPFSCVKVLTNFISSMLNQAIVSFSTNQVVDLKIPSIPPYNG